MSNCGFPNEICPKSSRLSGAGVEDDPSRPGSGQLHGVDFDHWHSVDSVRPLHGTAIESTVVLAGDGLRRCSRRSARNRPRRRSSTRVASDLAPRTPQTEFASSNKNGTINVVTTQLSGSGRSLGLQLAKHRRQANTGRTTQSSLYDINVVSMKMSYINVHMWLPVTERIRSHLPEITRILCMTPFGVDLVSPERETNGPLNPDVENAVRRRVYCPRPTTVYGALLDV